MTTFVNKVLVIGASGLTGLHLTKQLLNDTSIHEVHVLVRNPLTINSDKLHQHAIDFENLEIFEHLFDCDLVFCCLGTTMKKVRSEHEFRKVDVHLVANCALLASRSHAKKFVVISAIGAYKRSLFLYNRIKGEMEEKVQLNCDYGTQVIFCRPSLLTGERKEFRLAEYISIQISRWLGFIWQGFMRKYQPIEARQLANAMITLVKQQDTSPIRFVENDELINLSLQKQITY